jgi:hypothetical protein
MKKDSKNIFYLYPNIDFYIIFKANFERQKLYHWNRLPKYSGGQIQSNNCISFSMSRFFGDNTKIGIFHELGKVVEGGPVDSMVVVEQHLQIRVQTVLLIFDAEFFLCKAIPAN